GSLQWAAAAEDDERVARSAITALSSLATSEAIEALIALLADPRRRDACVEALAQMSKDRTEYIALGLRKGQVAVRRAVVDALTRMKHPRASELLGSALDDAEPAVRLAAATALRHLGSHFAAQKLAALARTDPDLAVRRAAQKALKR
ncbi:MAG TPA: HEAT repeat domain-containing protein, partial [Blastocatellia bacterium]|nr:HEAT repeat domain-containing protein [Blastocatellia bacterium]